MTPSVRNNIIRHDLPKLQLVIPLERPPIGHLNNCFEIELSTLDCLNVCAMSVLKWLIGLVKFSVHYCFFCQSEIFFGLSSIAALIVIALNILILFCITL